MGDRSDTIDSRPAAGSEHGPFERLQEEIAPLRGRLLSHPMYREIDTRERLGRFMEMHVFAVWDFMSLTKRLQRELTCTELPWLPPRFAGPARFVNEVVLSEETDLGLDGQPKSHLALYLEAMDEVGADTAVFRAFLARLRAGEALDPVLASVSVPGCVRAFVAATLRCALHGEPEEVAASFFFGREDVIPGMFEQLLGLWERGGAEVPHFTYYLRRHIELDDEQHGPLAKRMLVGLAGTEACCWALAAEAARSAIRQRIALWDGVRREIGTAPDGPRGR